MESLSREAEFRAELAGLDEAGRNRALQKAEDLLREARGQGARTEGITEYSTIPGEEKHG